MAKEIVHEDFGEKIGGAKKDLWAARGLYVDDLLGMNEREADKYVKKDNVWKKPDYNALIQSGVPVDILYCRKVVRDSLNASPRYLRSDDTPEKRLARQKEYIATVRQVQEAVEKVQTIQEAMGVFESLIIGGGYCERLSHGIGGGYIRVTPTGRAGRRVRQREEAGQKADYEAILRDIQQRDYQDSHRETAPLRPAEDSVLVDTSGVTFEESVQRLVELVRERL